MVFRGVGRRGFVAGLGASVATAHLWSSGARFARASPKAAPPRYWVHIVPLGGIDAVWTTDPRTAGDVRKGIDVPYPPSEIVTHGSSSFGPAFAALAPRGPELAVVNGVLVKAANHYTGVEHLTRLRTATTRSTPAAFGIVGAYRDSQPLAHTVLNPHAKEATTSSSFGDAGVDFGGRQGIFEVIDAASEEELHDLAGAIDREIKSLQRAGDIDLHQRARADAMGQARDLFRRVASAPRFVPPPARRWTSLFEGTGSLADLVGLSPVLERTLWMLENDLSATITVYSHFIMDSHAQNSTQQVFGAIVASEVVRFLDALGKRSNRFGPLADQTAVIVASELGRFPYLNQYQGKDHFPQSPVLFWGKPFRGGRTLGATGKELEALPIDVRTGREDRRGSRVVLDDIGHTVLRIAGVDPVSHGFGGRDLPFLYMEGGS